MPRGRAGPYDVAIVGFGPTGATLANLLGLCGLRVALLERERGIPRLPRAVHFDGEVMRIFQAIGVADRVAAVSRVNAGMRFVDPAGRLLLDWPRPQQVGPQGWHPSYRFHQPDLEAILRYRLSSVPNVDVVLGADVTAIAQDAELGSITYREGDRQHTADRQIRGRLRWRAVPGAYAHHEPGRRPGVPRTLAGDRSPAAPGAAGPGRFTIQYCHPETPMTYVRGPGLRRRWEIFIADLPDAQALAPANIWRRLARWLTPAEAEVERAAVYTFYSVIASSWRRARLLIAGDAAHQTPPFMGQGMCAGIRDASNLAWKLAHCIRRGHDDAMLDSYQSERHPQVRAFIKGAVDLGRLVNASDSEAALQSAFRQPDGSYRMMTLSPRLGPGLWQGGSPAAGLLKLAFARTNVPSTLTCVLINFSFVPRFTVSSKSLSETPDSSNLRRRFWLNVEASHACSANPRPTNQRNTRLHSSSIISFRSLRTPRT